jgi:PhoH-like ATPase
MKRNAVLDTNILMSYSNMLDSLIDEYNIILPLIVLEELDSLKTNQNPEKAYKAREGIRQIEKHYKDLTFTYKNDLIDGMELKNDNYIISSAHINNAILFTEDVAVKVKASAYDIECKSLGSKKDTEYKGYQLLSGGTAFINEFFEEINSGENKREFLHNEYLILYNTDLDELYEYRFDGTKFVDLKLPPSKVIKGLNSNQRCALDLLNNKDIPIKIIAGGFGSGKTMLSVKSGLYQVVAKEHYKSLLFIRNPIVADGTEIGFLPGDKSEKIYDFCRPFLQYVENEKDQFYAENLIKNEKIKMDVVSFLKGISIDDSFVIMDEAEDLNTKLMKLVGSRIGATSCIVFTGDWKQSENRYKHDNGLLRLIESSKGNPLVGIVVLEEDVRSSTSKLFAEL